MVTIDLQKWIAYQIWLGFKNQNQIPYAMALGDLIDPRADRLRRDFPRILCLIETHAIMHQKSREKVGGWIQANLDDYREVYKLVNNSISSRLWVHQLPGALGRL